MLFFTAAQHWYMMWLNQILTSGMQQKAEGASVKPESTSP